MKIGVHLVSFTLPDGPASIASTLAAVGRTADEVGVANLSLMDHYFQIGVVGAAEEPMLEGYTSLGFLAAHNTSAELQLLVTGVTYRHPGLLAKIVTTLDVLSGGRAALGIGAAWYEREHAALGVRYPPVAERFERLEETLQIVRQMWSEDNGPFEGKHYQLAETINSAFNGSEIKIGDYAREARISSTTASRDLNRAATAGLLVAQKHPQLGVTYRAGSFLMQAVAYGLGLNFGDAEALNADSIVSKVVDSLRVTR